MSYQAIRGMSDIAGEEALLFRTLEHQASAFLENLSYQEIRTPLLEYTDLFVRSIGQQTDIVNKEMYTFQDRKGRSLSLRPEMTASVVRAVIEHGWIQTEETSRFYYIGPMFRAERPQAGRRRQFHQLGVELFGRQSVYQDAEILILLRDLLVCLGLKGDSFQIKLNTIGLVTERARYNQALREYLEKYRSDLGPDDARRLSEIVLRVLDSKDPKTRQICQDAPLLSHFLGPESLQYQESLQTLLAQNNIAYVSDPFLVRGLDYYQQTVFEVACGILGAQDALGAGGRYDGLLRQFGGPDLGGIGFALGVERLIIALQAAKHDVTKAFRLPLICLVHSGSDASKNACLRLRRVLAAGLKVQTTVDFVKGSMKSQLRQADRLKADFVLIAGDDELSCSVVLLKKMHNGEQWKIREEELEDRIQTEWRKESNA